MQQNARLTWIRRGTLASLAMAALLAVFRRRKAARFFAALAAACGLEWRDATLAREVGILLAKAGREA